MSHNENIDFFRLFIYVMLGVALTCTNTPHKKKKKRYTSDVVLKMKYTTIAHECMKFYCPTDLPDSVGALLDLPHLDWASG